ncbi:MAG: hypothetical protein JRJ59_03190 [Deltaproteobacteria bacterium]|nr:hypothetical protein [Deltaproteobacteria bacterium]
MAGSSHSGHFMASPTLKGIVEVRLEKPALRYTRICYLPRELFTWLAQQLTRRGCPLEQT